MLNLVIWANTHVSSKAFLLHPWFVITTTAYLLNQSAKIYTLISFFLYPSIRYYRDRYNRVLLYAIFPWNKFWADLVFSVWNEHFFLNGFTSCSNYFRFLLTQMYTCETCKKILWVWIHLSVYLLKLLRRFEFGIIICYWVSSTMGNKAKVSIVYLINSNFIKLGSNIITWTTC